MKQDISKIIEYVKVLEGRSGLDVEGFAYNKNGSIARADHSRFVYDGFHRFTIEFRMDGVCRFFDIETGECIHQLTSEYVMDLHKVLRRGTVTFHGETHKLDISRA